MKIKAVCEASGLTDRTVRYYIEEELIFPAYTENYLGRKTFDFSEADIQQLTDIAVLRKFGFSIAEIKEMIQNPQRIVQIIKDLQCRKQAFIDEENKLLQVLLRLDDNATYTVAELAAYLSTPVLDTPLPEEDKKWDISKIIITTVKSIIIFVITWCPVVLSVLVLMSRVHEYHYPVFFPPAIALTLISLLPTLLTVVLPKIKSTVKLKPLIRKILLILCVLSIPFSFFWSFGIVSRSETTDFRNYRDLDPECIANRSDLFQDLFPKWPHYFVNEKQPDGSWNAVYLDAHYYYQYSLGWDYTYDIYAEWPLEQEEFYEEVDRVKSLFDIHAPSEEDRSTYRNYLTIQKGSYTCLIIYTGTPPFEEATSSYTYCIFAYDEQNLKVRYIYCDSLDDGVDQPYYLSLDWE